MSKRKKPEQTYWSDVNIDVLPLKDLRVLLQNRKVGNLPGKRSELEALLTKKDVEIDYNDSFTIRQLQVELRLRGLDDTTAKKKVYLQRLRGEVAAPAKKKLRKGQRKKRQHKALGTKVHVAFYQSPIDDSKKDDEDTKVLGIFSSQQNAYNLLVDKLLEDLKKKKMTKLLKIWRKNVKKKVLRVSWSSVSWTNVCLHLAKTSNLMAG